MKQQDIKELSSEELVARLADEQHQLNKLVMTHAVSPIENPMKIRWVRRGIARIKTEISKRAGKATNN
ncbi:MAG: ribosomal protein [Bacteroidota bacterium]|jgi:large subunit ribosomal protein L29